MISKPKAVLSLLFLIFFSSSAAFCDATTEAIHAWFVGNQNANATGLVASHPQDASFIYHEGIVAEWAKIYNYTQAYTYDEALAGMLFVRQGNLAAAKRISDFYYADYENQAGNFSGFWTVYNVDPNFQWKKYEWRKGMGENAWMGLFALRYRSAVTNPVEKDKALTLATEIGRWILNLPHFEGAVAMSPDNPGGNPNFGRLYSVENNLDYYSLAKKLSSAARSADDRARFGAEAAALKNWLKTHAFDPAAGLFRRGGRLDGSGVFIWDGVASLDVNSWAIAALSLPVLRNEFRIDPASFASAVQNAFVLQNDNSFGGNVQTAKGFDFSDAANAAAVGRSGTKWVEGTNQMVVDYQLLGNFYRKGFPAQSATYDGLANYFLSRNAEDAVSGSGTISYVYADQAGVQIYNGTPNWRTPTGAAAPSAAWAYFAAKKFNPFSDK